MKNIYVAYLTFIMTTSMYGMENDKQLEKGYDCKTLMSNFSYLQRPQAKMNDTLQESLADYQRLGKFHTPLSQKIATLICFGANPNEVKRRRKPINVF